MKQVRARGEGTIEAELRSCTATLFPRTLLLLYPVRSPKMTDCVEERLNKNSFYAQAQVFRFYSSVTSM
jgi:hypothetical protein